MLFHHSNALLLFSTLIMKEILDTKSILKVNKSKDRVDLIIIYHPIGLMRICIRSYK